MEAAGGLCQVGLNRQKEPLLHLGSTGSGLRSSHSNAVLSNRLMKVIQWNLCDRSVVSRRATALRPAFKTVQVLPSQSRMVPVRSAGNEESLALAACAGLSNQTATLRGSVSAPDSRSTKMSSVAIRAYISSRVTWPSVEWNRSSNEHPGRAAT